MPAILPNYEYDIFISYRQNDNQPPRSSGGQATDGWVTNFVAALKDELEATLKNPVTIYFDENPHDGLLETHQVNASLEKKLKCLVFIPIISQTFCDTSSFAWEHEFLPFLKMAGEDEIGMNVTLANGNVASRVLPVKIHDLDDGDQSILEQELGGPIRSIDFIYKEPGVNRPLKVDDTKNENLNKTNYHNQINKVANALKEMGTALVANNSSDDENGEGLNKRIAKPNSSTKKGNRTPKLIATFFLIPLFFALLYFFYQTYSGGESNQIDDLEKSIAVLAFRNMSNDPEQEYFSDGISEEIINAISNIEGLKVAGRSSSFYFKGKNEDLRVIADKLDVAMILEGSVRKSGDQLRITAQLINAETGFNIWSNTFSGDITDIFKVQDEIAKSVIDKLKISLLTQETTAAVKYQPKQEAYDLYLKGIYHWNKRGKNLYNALDYFTKATEVDSLYSLAFASLAQTYVLFGFYELQNAREVFPLAKINADKALSLNNNSPEAYSALGFYYLYYEWDAVQAEVSFRLAIEANYNYAPAHYWYNNVLTHAGQFSEAIKEGTVAIELEPLAILAHVTLATAYLQAEEYEQALEVYSTGHELNPFILTYVGIANSLSGLKRYHEAEEILLSGIDQLDRNPFLLSPLCVLYGKTGRIEEATVILEELISRQKTEHISYLMLARATWAIGKEDEAIEYYKKALKYKSSQLVTQVGLYADISPKLKFIDEALNLFSE